MTLRYEVLESLTKNCSKGFPLVSLCSMNVLEKCSCVKSLILEICAAYD